MLAACAAQLSVLVTRVPKELSRAFVKMFPTNTNSRNTERPPRTVKQTTGTFSMSSTVQF